MNYHYALVASTVPTSLTDQALRSDPKGPPVDYEHACREHQAYTNLLKKLGLNILTVNIDHNHPDSVFVEDTCVIVGKTVLLTHLGHPNREAEASVMRKELERLDKEHVLGLRLVLMSEKARLDGGDVLFTGTEFFVGMSSRTNKEGLDELQACFQLPCHPVEVQGLHLKSVCSIAGQNLHGRTVIAIGSSTIASEAAKQIKEQQTTNYQFVSLPDDPAANCLSFNKHLVVREEYPDSLKVFRKLGIPSLHTLTNQELAKVDGALTCCSVLF